MSCMSNASLVCSFAAGEFPLQDPRAFNRTKHQRAKIQSRHTVRIVIVENKEAQLKFPILWKALEGELERWQIKAQAKCTVRAHRDNGAPSALSAWWRRYEGQENPKDNRLNWFDNCTTSATRVVVLERHGDERVQNALDHVAKFDRYVGALGLLPRGLRNLISRRNEKTSKKQREEDTWRLEELSRTVFSGTFRIWTERRRRNLAWWRHKRSDSLRPKRKRQRGRGSQKKKQKPAGEAQSQKPPRSSARLAARRQSQVSSARSVIV